MSASDDDDILIIEGPILAPCLGAYVHQLAVLSALERPLEPDQHPALDRHIGQQAAMLELLELEATK